MGFKAQRMRSAVALRRTARIGAKSDPLPFGTQDFSPATLFGGDIACPPDLLVQGLTVAKGNLCLLV